MSHTEGTPGFPRPPRFPFVAAALCVASLVAAAWLFFRYSYVWDVRAGDFAGCYDYPHCHPMLGRYVRLGGVFREDRGAHRGTVTGAREGGHEVPILLDWTEPIPEKEADVELQGRVVLARSQGSIAIPHRKVAVDCTHSRWHGATVAGFVVGAWGVFIFAVALGHWLGLRRGHTVGPGDDRS